MRFYLFTHTPFHHLQLCQILANSDTEIIEDKILGPDSIPYAKLLVEASEDLFDILTDLPGISTQPEDELLDI